jgi:hypothetical protein
MHNTQPSAKSTLTKLKNSSLASAASKEILIIDNHSINFSKLHRAKSMSSTGNLNATNQQLYQKAKVNLDSQYSSKSGISTKPLKGEGEEGINSNETVEEDVAERFGFLLIISGDSDSLNEDIILDLDEQKLAKSYHESKKSITTSDLMLDRATYANFSLIIVKRKVQPPTGSTRSISIKARCSKRQTQEIPFFRECPVWQV